MHNKSRRMALCGVMCALAAAIMMMGGIFPLATFCSPAIAGLVLIPVFIEAGKRLALGAYAAIAALSLMLCPDKESALLFAFLGYYPILKWTLEKIRQKPLRILAKLSVFNIAAAAMLASMAFLLNMQAVLQEYAEMTNGMLVVFILLSNFTMLMYDRVLSIMTVLYLKKFRSQWIRNRGDRYE